MIGSVMRLLLLSLIRAGVNGDDGLIPAERSHDITYPCGDDVCYHVWHLSTDETSNDIAIVSNGKIQTSKLEDDESKCSLRIKDLTVEDVGSHRCQRRPNVHNTSPGAPVINLMARKTLFLQCVLLTFVERGHCFTEGQQQISLMWVDETGAQLQDDAQHQIEQLHSCEVTLTVTLQRPENKKFRCLVMAGGQVQTSVELRVRARGMGRGLVVELEPENQGHSQDTVGAAVGVVGCLVLTLLVAAFVVNRRRANSRLPDESRNTISTNNALNTDDVIYADIILPVGSDRVFVQQWDATEYACIRYE
ncbi:uncharacterized protein LOC118470852 [Amphiprion ocellaris]|uniref:uncharacterized protein LOC118470852 n=1 Tax=Amphiprion ocellaris TaxID=80972 RepID=UPI00241184FB|nr:uncharacterized protein LOC118470852 [Amphiprion ocellaris]